MTGICIMQLCTYLWCIIFPQPYAAFCCRAVSCSVRLAPGDPSWDDMLRLTLPHKAGQCLIARPGLSQGRALRWYQGPRGERMQLECVHGGRSSQRRLLSAYHGCFFATWWREGPKLWQGSCNGYSCVSCFLRCHGQGLPFTSSPPSIIRWISNYTAQEAGYLDWAIECGSSR